MGLERRGAGLLRGASGTGPAAQAGEVGARICHPSRRALTVGRRLDSRRRLQLGVGKGLEFKVGRGGSGSGPGPAVVATGRRRAACPCTAIYGPEAKGPRRARA